MRIYSRSTPKRFWDKHPDAAQPLRAWFAEAKKVHWKAPSEIKARYRTASFVGDDRVVFNIGGNKYRLVVALSYARATVFVRFVGTHPEYDRIEVLNRRRSLSLLMIKRLHRELGIPGDILLAS